MVDKLDQICLYKTCRFLQYPPKRVNQRFMKKSEILLNNARTLHTLRTLRDTLGITPITVARATDIPVRTVYTYYEKDPNITGHLDKLQSFVWELENQCQKIKSGTILT